MADILSVNTGLVGLLTAIGALWVALKKRPSEIRVMDADAATKLSNAAASLVAPLEARLNALDRELGSACVQIEKLEDEVSNLKAENALLADWAQRLVHQVRSLGGYPVEMKPNPWPLP